MRLRFVPDLQAPAKNKRDQEEGRGEEIPSHSRERAANVLNSSRGILGWILHARCMPFIFPASDAALRPAADLIPFKSDVLCGWKNAAKQRKSVDPGAPGALALFINPA